MAKRPGPTWIFEVQWFSRPRKLKKLFKKWLAHGCNFAAIGAGRAERRRWQKMMLRQ